MKASKRPLGKKVVDEVILLKRPRRGALLREEVWRDADGVVTKYNLAYINWQVCRVDNGRVLGYDNGHGFHHRHFMGKVHAVDFIGYEALAVRFRDEVFQLWEQEDESD